MQSASSNSENFSQNSLSKPVSSKKKRPSLNSGSSKKIKRGVPTPLRQEIAARRITTPVAPSAAAAATASNTMAPPAPLSAHKSQRKKKKKKRTLPTPLRGEISARRVATPAKEKEALLDHVAQVEEMVQVRSSKKQKRGLPTPVRNAIGSRRVHTPAAVTATATAALPTPLRTAIDSRRVATPAASSSSSVPLTPADVIADIFASGKKSSKKKKIKSSKKSSKKKSKRVATPLRSQIEARRVTTPANDHTSAASMIVFEKEEEEFEQLKESSSVALVSEKRMLPTPLRSAIGSRRILTPVAPGAEQAMVESPEESPMMLQSNKKRALPTPLRQKIAALRVVTPVAPSSPAETMVLKGASTPFLLFGGEMEIDEEEYEEEEEEEEYNDEEEDVAMTDVEEPPAAVKVVEFQGKKTTFSSPSPKFNRYSVHWTYEDYEKDEAPKTPVADATYDGLSELMKTPVGLEKYFTEEEIQQAAKEAEEFKLLEEEEEEEEEETPAVEKEIVAPIVEEVVAPIEEEIVAPIEEEVVAPIEEEIVAPIEEEVVAPIEELTALSPGPKTPPITNMKQVKACPVVFLRSLQVGSLMEALSYDEDDEVYDWFNCIITSKYRKNKGVQLRFVDEDNQPDSDKEWSVRLKIREDLVTEEVEEEEEEEEDEEEEVDYSSLRVVDLTKELKSRGLSHKGRKAQLIARLEEDDAAE